jgi:sugar phosphate isomerase/epimerase
MTDRLISLAAGTVLDVGPARAVDVAAAAGFPAVGLWFDPATWTVRTTVQVRDRLAATGLVALDIEPIIPGRGDDHGERLIDLAAELGVPNVLMASGLVERSATVERLGQLCAYAATAAPALRVSLEFLPIFSVGSLSAAWSILNEVGARNAAILVDTLHLARSGGAGADVAEIDPWLFPYLQLADAPVMPPDPTPAGLREEALHGRLLPGEGDLDLAATLRAVPDAPVSVELRSRALMEQYPDAVERAKAVLTATQRCLALSEHV